MSVLDYDVEIDDDERPFDPTAPLVATGNLRRRKITSAFVERGATLAAILAVVVLAIVVWSVFKNGASALSWDFLTKNPPAFGGSSGGIATAIVGTALIVGIATALAMPIGILIALFVTEFAPARAGAAVRLALDLINGLPSIVIGLFVFGLLVSGHHQSAFAAAVALVVQRAIAELADAGQPAAEIVIDLEGVGAHQNARGAG